MAGHDREGSGNGLRGDRVLEQLGDHRRAQCCGVRGVRLVHGGHGVHALPKWSVVATGRNGVVGFAGLPLSVASAATSTALDQLIIDSHNEAFDEVGLDVGTPVLRISGTALFGPVITPAPRVRPPDDSGTA
ncbi:mycothiol-dependent nitroreductase Rv2466c family protein [Micromonospora sp. SH-82]|uniref:mycothiol-dependent nitroreductase Rv2466c family protein n=1 Tax=Micromonospora sp. SH-82 TaxID=3132938 RepID=UPI003EBB396B